MIHRTIQKMDTYGVARSTYVYRAARLQQSLAILQTIHVFAFRTKDFREAQKCILLLLYRPPVGNRYQEREGWVVASYVTPICQMGK